MIHGSSARTDGSDGVSSRLLAAYRLLLQDISLPPDEEIDVDQVTLHSRDLVAILREERGVVSESGRSTNYEHTLNNLLNPLVGLRFLFASGHECPPGQDAAGRHGRLWGHFVVSDRLVNTYLLLTVGIPVVAEAELAPRQSFVPGCFGLSSVEYVPLLLADCRQRRLRPRDEFVEALAGIPDVSTVRYR